MAKGITPMQVFLKWVKEFFNSHHPDPNDPDRAESLDEQFPDGMFRFEKRICY